MKRLLWLLLIGFFLTGSASGFINPKFTPVNLCGQSERILLVEFQKISDKGVAEVKIVKVIKGKTDQKTLEIDLLAGASKQSGKTIIKQAKSTSKQALLFIGPFELGEGQAAMQDDEETPPVGLLHVGKDWVVLEQFKPGIWDMVKIDRRLLGTWSGSDEMLRRAVAYILSDKNADIPINSNVKWASPVAAGKIKGAVHHARSICLAAKAPEMIYLAAADGDRLMQLDPKTQKMQDVAASRKLTARSKASAWNDFNRDGRLDLLSWDGKGLTLYSGQADGTFSSTPIKIDGAVPATCTLLSSVDCGKDGVGVVAATPEGPMLIIFDKDAKPTVKTLSAGEHKKVLGNTDVCLVADMDGDAVVDIMQVSEAGSLFYKGVSPGVFAAPVPMNVAMGKGGRLAVLGDYDMDGQFDIFVSAEDNNAIWHNLGKGKFEEMLAMSGEIEYIAKSGASSATIGDVNNNGRQDILILYPKLPPLVFFNRGFHSFGHARMLDVVQQKLLSQASEGQQAGCLGDFNNDGALDMFLVLSNGEMWLFPRAISKEDGVLAAVAKMASAKDGAGPVTVSGHQEKRCFGAYSIRPGDSVVFGLAEPGPVTLKWTVPGQKSASQEVFVEEGRLPVVLNKK